MAPNFKARKKLLPKNQLITVYKAVNAARKEIYIGMTDRLFDDMVREFATYPPEKLKHWLKGDGIEFEGLAYSVPLSGARRFVERYVDNHALKDWKLLFD